MKKLDRQDYWNQRSETYLEEIEETFGEANHKIINQIKKYCNKNDIVLDIGCGPGVITKDIAGSVKKIKAIDISPEMINKARKNDLANVEWEVKDLTTRTIQLWNSRCYSQVTDLKLFTKRIYLSPPIIIW